MSSSTGMKFYKQNGYYIAKGLLAKPANLLQNVLIEIDTVILQQLKSNETPSSNPLIIHQHLHHLFNLDLEAYISSLKLCANLLSVHSTLTNMHVTEMAQSLGIQLPALQGAPVLHIMADNLKIPGGYNGTRTHQDWPSLQGSLDTIIVWIPLMPVNLHNFPVEVAPGSHLGGLYPGEVSENVYKTHPDSYEENSFIAAELDYGDVLFLSAFTLHRTRLSDSNGFRIAVSTRYDNASETTFIHRKYPFAQKRVVTRDFLHPNFPTLEQVKEIFTKND